MSARNAASVILRLHQAYKRVLESEDGQLIMQDLESRGFFMVPTISATPGRTEFNEGRRSIVLHVKRMADETKFVGYAEEVNNA